MGTAHAELHLFLLPLLIPRKTCSVTPVMRGEMPEHRLARASCITLPSLLRLLPRK